ncbi:hypothetical protein L9F63_022048 [Diploptera punctata]|uniref:RING-type domain-containing protein n=1 Tax=Diploptera punctata TaxID=6984 RepID=A0AAD8EBB9_DIPPU|nr:hypothetical protein L9F63_022048 [Diploptera punctata]
MTDPGKPNPNIPPHCGDVRSPLAQTQIQTSTEEEDREITYTTETLPADFITLFGAMQLTTNTSQREDLEQTYWGDNEQSSSENEVSVRLCKTCRKGKLKILGCRTCDNIVQLRNCRKKKWERRKKKLAKRKGQLEISALPLLPLLKDNWNNEPSTSATNGKPPIHSGPSVARLYMAQSRKRKLNLKVKSSSSSGSDTPLIDSATSKKSDTSLLYQYQNNKFNILSEELCSLCKSRPKNAVIIHEYEGHQCYCYQCTLKLWRLHGNCPLCQCKFYKFVRMKELQIPNIEED